MFLSAEEWSHARQGNGKILFPALFPSPFGEEKGKRAFWGRMSLPARALSRTFLSSVYPWLGAGHTEAKSDL